MKFCCPCNMQPRTAWRPCAAGTHPVPVPAQRQHPCSAVAHAAPSPLRRPHRCPCDAVPRAAPVPTRARRALAPAAATHCSSPPATGGSPLCRGPRSPRGPGSSAAAPRRPPAGQREGASAGARHPQRLAGAVPGAGAGRGAAAEPGLGAGAPYLAGPLHGPRLAASPRSARRHHPPALCGVEAGAGRVGRERKSVKGGRGQRLVPPRDVAAVPRDGDGAVLAAPIPPGRCPGSPGKRCPATVGWGNQGQGAAEPPQRCPPRTRQPAPAPPRPRTATGPAVSRARCPPRLDPRPRAGTHTTSCVWVGSPIDPRTRVGSHTAAPTLPRSRQAPGTALGRERGN